MSDAIQVLLPNVQVKAKGGKDTVIHSQGATFGDQLIKESTAIKHKSHALNFMEALQGLLGKLDKALAKANIDGKVIESNTEISKIMKQLEGLLESFDQGMFFGLQQSGQDMIKQMLTKLVGQGSQMSTLPVAEMNQTMEKLGQQLSSLMKKMAMNFRSELSVPFKTNESSQQTKQSQTNVSQKVTQAATEMMKTTIGQGEKVAVQQSFITQTSLPKDNNVAKLDIGFQTGTMHKLQQMALHQSPEMKPQPNVSQQVIQKIEQLMAKGQMSLSNDGKQQISLKLTPAHLGRLDISIVREGNIITAKIIAQNVAAKELIQTQLQQLKQGLLGQNINVQRIDIHALLQSQETAEQGQGQQYRDESSSEQQDQESNNRRYNEWLQDDDSEETFLDWLEKEVMNDEN